MGKRENNNDNNGNGDVRRPPRARHYSVPCYVFFFSIVSAILAQVGLFQKLGYNVCYPEDGIDNISWKEDPTIKTNDMTSTKTATTTTRTTATGLPLINFRNTSSTSTDFTEISSHRQQKNHDHYHLRQRRIFSCGWKIGHLRQYLFPDLQYVGLYHYQDNETYPTDILYFGMHGKCPTTIKQIIENFSGKVLFINGEPFGHVLDYFGSYYSSWSTSRLAKSNVYQIGGPIARQPLNEAEHHHLLGVYYAAQALVGYMTPEQWQWIADPKQRPKSSWWWNIHQKIVEERMSTSTGEGTTTNATTNASKGTKEDMLQPHQPPSPSSELHNQDGTRRGSKAIYLSNNCKPFRQKAAKIISSIITLDVGGSCRVSGESKKKGTKKNEGGGNDKNKNKQEHGSRYIDLEKEFPDTNATRSRHFDNWKIYRHYKYCVVMENSNLEGYLSEKIIWAYLGGCLPIYWGSKADVYQVFNPDSFLFWNVRNMTKSLSKLRHLESNDTAYMEAMSAPILRHYIDDDDDDDDDDSFDGEAQQRIGQREADQQQQQQPTLEQFFSLTDDIGKGKLKQKIRAWLEIPPPVAGSALSRNP